LLARERDSLRKGLMERGTHGERDWWRERLVERGTHGERG